MGLSSALISSQEILRYIIFRPKVVYGILEHFSYNLPIRKLLVTFFCYLSLFPISILLHPQTSLTSPGLAWLYPFVQSCLVSPLCIGAMLEYSEAVPTLSVISNSIFNVYPQVRQAHAPLEEAIECLDKGIARGDVIRKNKFDVYLPPRRYYEGDVNCRIVGSGESRRETTDDKRIDGLVFLPGMWVNHASYATCATRLAKSGLVVVVISAEPLQLPTHLLGAGFADIEIAKKWVEKELRSRGSKASIDWSLGGHSMGAYTSLKLAYKNRCAMRKLVIWGAGSFPERVPDLSECIDLNILSVHASLDVSQVLNTI